EQQRRLQRLRQEAAEYYRGQQVPQRMEEALNTLFPLRPADLYGEMANYFSKLSKPPVICKVVGRKVLDGVGLPTLEVEIHCTVKNCEKRICSIIIPSHFQIPDNALPETTEADEKERNDSVNTAVKWVNESLNTMLRDLKPTDQCKVDKMLGEYFTTKVEEKKEIQKQEEEAEEAEATPTLASCTPAATALPGQKKAEKTGFLSVAERMIPPAEPIEPVLCGSSAIGGTSLATAKAGATINHIPLYLYIALLKHEQKFFLRFKWNFPCSTLCPLPLVLSLGTTEKSLAPSSLHIRISPHKVSPQPSLLQAEESQLSQPFLIREMLQSPSHLLLCIYMCANKVIVFGFNFQPQALKRVSHLGCLIIGYDNLEQLLLIIQTACEKKGLKLGTDMYLAINCAAHELMDYVKGKYETLTGTFKSPDEMVDMYVELINKFPFIIALIDPLRKEDQQQWSHLCRALGSKCYLIAEEAARCISRHKTDQMINIPTCSGVVLKYINQTKVSDLIELTGHLDDQRHITILGSPDGESSDDSLVDLAVGLGARFIKLGGLLRGERVTKYNRLRAIEEELAKNRTLR
ncbi:ENO4 Enolase, partial [Hemiprocne comata]|nr:ENO4 Enolase [Hemiprocne comata]